MGKKWIFQIFYPRMKFKVRRCVNKMLRDDIKRRNEERWQNVAQYIDYIVANYYFDKPMAASIDIDGYLHFFEDDTTMDMDNWLAETLIVAS